MGSLEVDCGLGGTFPQQVWREIWPNRGGSGETGKHRRTSPKLASTSAKGRQGRET